MGGICALVGAAAWTAWGLFGLGTDAPEGRLIYIAPLFFGIAPLFFGLAVLGFGIAGPHVGVSRWRYVVVVTAGVVATALGLVGATGSLFDALRGLLGFGAVNNPVIALLGGPGLVTSVAAGLLNIPLGYYLLLPGLDVILSLGMSTSGVLLLGWPRGSQLASGVRRAVVAAIVAFFLAQSMWEARSPGMQLHAAVILVPLVIAWAWIGWHGASLHRRGTPPAARPSSA